MPQNYGNYNTKAKTFLRLDVEESFSSSSDEAEGSFSISAANAFSSLSRPWSFLSDLDDIIQYDLMILLYFLFELMLKEQHK